MKNIDSYVREFIDDDRMVEDCECWSEYVEKMKDWLLVCLKERFGNEIEWIDLKEEVRLDFLDGLREEWDLWVYR